MCMIDGGETYQFWSHKTVKKAKKAHTCSECCREISPGETYEYYSCGPSVWNGWDCFWICLHCMVACDWLTETCGGFVHERAADDIGEHAREYRSMDLYRLLIGMCRQWKKKSGGLMPLPRVKELSVK